MPGSVSHLSMSTSTNASMLFYIVINYLFISPHPMKNCWNPLKSSKMNAQVVSLMDVLQVLMKCCSQLKHLLLTKREMSRHNTLAIIQSMESIFKLHVIASIGLYIFLFHHLVGYQMLLHFGGRAFVKGMRSCHLGRMSLPIVHMFARSICSHLFLASNDANQRTIHKTTIYLCCASGLK